MSTPKIDFRKHKATGGVWNTMLLDNEPVPAYYRPCLGEQGEGMAGVNEVEIDFGKYVTHITLGEDIDIQYHQSEEDAKYECIQSYLAGIRLYG